ncbi:MAG: PEP-CTERM sorting domain-containing protein [Planctomycetota bacterium]
MNTRLNQLSMLPAAALALMAASPTDASIVAYSEDFNYANNAELQAAWIDGDTGNPAFQFFRSTSFTSAAAGQTVDPVAGGPVARLANELVYDTLDQTVTEDWTLTFKALSTNYQRGQFVALMNADGTEGYALNWDTAQSTQFNGEGNVRLRKLDFASSWSTFGVPANTVLATLNQSGHPATGFPYDQSTDTYSTEFAGFAEFELSWEKATGTLTVSVNGNVLGSAVDTDFDTFDRIYLRGNTNLVVDDIIVTTIPEPGSLSLLAVGLAAVCARGRRPLT